MTLSYVWTARGTAIRTGVNFFARVSRWSGEARGSCSHHKWECGTGLGCGSSGGQLLREAGNRVPLLMGHQGCQHWCEEQKVAALLRALCLWQDNRCLSTEATEGAFVAASSDEGRWKARWAVWDGAKVQQPQRNLEVKVFQGCVGNDQLWFREWTKMWEICV